MKTNTISRFLFFLLFFTQFGFGQLSNFTLTVNPTNETCTENGALTFSVTNTVAGASMLYSIYLLPNTTTPIATLAGNSYGGLSAGNYLVVATQSLGGQSASKQQDVEIEDDIIPLTYQLTGINSAGCVNSGQIIVNVTSGTAVNYEIFAGPMIRPLQTSNIFTGLSAGVYQIRVFDNCNEGVVQTFTLLSAPAALNISGPSGTPPPSCAAVPVIHNFTAPAGTVIAYPLTVVLTLFPPGGGAPIVYNQTITSGNSNSVQFTQLIALYANQNYTYNLSVTDACGNGYSLNSAPAASIITPAAIPMSAIINCVNQYGIQVIQVQTVILVSAPAAYANPLPQNFTAALSGGILNITNIPPGNYTFSVTDVCGNPHTLNVNLSPAPIPQPNFVVREGCDSGHGSVSITNPSGPIASVTITMAPSAYTLGTLPHNVSFNIDPSGIQNFQMNMLPIGNYRFRVVDNCGNQFNVNVTIQGHIITNNFYDVIENCGSFNLQLNYSSNNSFNNTFWLQKLNPLTNQWGHPATGVVYNPGDVLGTLNARVLTNNTLNLNLAYLGTFRIIMSYQVFGLGGFASTYCTRVLQQFEFDSTPQIQDVYSFSCSPTSSDVIVVATGLGPLIYSITTKNGLPFVINNGTSNTFLGLEPAIYIFQVQDACGNILNAEHDITTPYDFQIIPNNLCDGQTASLSVASFPFLNYTWYAASAPTVPLSNTAQLTFPNFNSATSQGTYFVHIVNPAATSCIDETLNYTVTVNPAGPNAGSNGAVSYCGSQSNIDLFTLLTGPYDTNGVWSALSTGGSLSNNIWNSSGVAPGIYQFKYTVTGFCNASDDATVTITIKEIPQTPTASANPVVCASQPLQLFATAVPNAVYQWTGPNNFTSNVQNPVIAVASAVNSGVYSVQTSLNGCISGSASVSVQVVPMPLAGSNSSVTYCGSQATIDLFALLAGTYDLNGVWSPLATGGILVNHIWDATGLFSGVYPFQYSVTGLCGTTVHSVVTITLNPVPQPPIATVAPIVCDTQAMQLFANTVPNATYQWSGPNGFSSNVQNPVLDPVSAQDNGVYSVQVTQNGCLSAASSVTVQVAPQPQFEIRLDCIDNVAVLSATPVLNSFNAATAIYQWSNADGFSSTANPAVITGEVPGLYSLTVTNAAGCQNTHSIAVDATLCTVPQGISPNGDGLNDVFDLSGLPHITQVKIYNRYGMVVFEQDNYSKEWMGQDSRGNMLPSATYFYLIDFENEPPRTGWVYLLREN